MFSAAAALYAVVGLATGLLIAGARCDRRRLILDGELAARRPRRRARPGAVTAVGIAASVYLDALRAERLFVRAAAPRSSAVALYLALMLALILAGADLGALIAASGAMPLFSGLLSAAAVAAAAGLARALPARRRHPRALMAIVPTAGWLLVVELSNLAMYAFSRVILGAYRSPAAVGLFEGPVRAHNLLYALGGALAVPVVPTASRYVADRRRAPPARAGGARHALHARAVRAAVCVTLMALAEPILEVWLGDRYGEAATALAILVSYWLLYGGLVVTPGFLVGAGRARELARSDLRGAAANLALALVLTPELGLEGPALATGDPVRRSPSRSCCGSGWRLGRLARRAAPGAWLPAYSLGAAAGRAARGARPRPLDGRDAAAGAGARRRRACSPTGPPSTGSCSTPASGRSSRPAQPSEAELAQQRRLAVALRGLESIPAATRCPPRGRRSGSRTRPPGRSRSSTL